MGKTSTWIRRWVRSSYDPTNLEKTIHGFFKTKLKFFKIQEQTITGPLRDVLLQCFCLFFSTPKFFLISEMPHSCCLHHPCLCWLIAYTNSNSIKTHLCCLNHKSHVSVFIDKAAIKTNVLLVKQPWSSEIFVALKGPEMLLLFRFRGVIGKFHAQPIPGSKSAEKKDLTPCSWDAISTHNFHHESAMLPLRKRILGPMLVFRRFGDIITCNSKHWD